MSKSSLKQLTFKNIGYNTIARILTYISSVVCSIVLGRCLLASDYGIVSFAFIFINFMEKFADIGIGSAIVQKRDLDENTLYTAFTLKFVLGCAVTVSVFIISSIIPYFFDNRNIVVVVQLLSLSFICNNISFIPNSLLTREMDFKKISVIETAMHFLNSIVAITFALNGYGYWSIVIAYLLSNIFGAATLALIKPVTIRFYFDFRIAKELVNFGGYLFLSGFFVFLMSNFDNIIIGSVNGAKELGYYALAFNWGSMICLLMYSVVLRVIFPVMAKMQDQEHDIKRSYLKTLEYSGYLVVLANIVLFVMSKDLLITVLGHGSGKWLPALTALRILCFYGIVRGLLEPVGQVIVALGKTQILFKANLFASVIEAIAIYPCLVYFGIEGVASAVTFAYLSQYITYYYYLKRIIDISIVDLLNAIKPSVISALPILILYATVSISESFSLLFVIAKSIGYTLIYIIALCIVTNFKVIEYLKHIILSRKRAHDLA